MRVGTTLYKVVNQPCASGGYEKRRVIWNNSTLRQDYGKNYLATVPKYDGFCTVPDHLNYRKEIDGFLNLYEPIEHTPQILQWAASFRMQTSTTPRPRPVRCSGEASSAVFSKPIKRRAVQPHGSF